MPSEDTTTISMTEEARRHVAAIAKRAERAGEPFPVRTVKRREGRRTIDAVEVRLSPIVHRALAFAAEGMTFGAQPKDAASLPPTNHDGARLVLAMSKAGIGARALARDLGGYHHSIIGQVKKGSLALSVAMGGALLEWVERVERG